MSDKYKIGGEEKVVEVVVLGAKDKRLSVRLSEEQEQFLNELKEDLQKENPISELTDSDVVRFALNYAYKQWKEKKDEE